MTDTTADLTIYARVEDGVIVEYPVYGLHIKNRSHPIDWYTKAVFEPKPDLPQFHYYTENKRLVDGRVIVSYDVVPYTLDAMLSELHAPSEQGGEPTIPVFANLDPNVIGRIIDLARELVQKRLDKFANLKNYDTIHSAVGYKGSKVPSFDAEATIAADARDDSWIAMYTYIGQVQAAVLPVPASSLDILQQLPELSWD